ncbi:MAG: hypothetical protein E6H00_02000 [Bacillati bacterium ANGP1]|uniref:Cation/H+ exchanger domain-containing protein n=1 Tax=Candidatus Segetimicrobium genomatis TaxID=2569760 RepID=A0A537KAY0_9BACT|nr:MAG: hypothetical protein E6H00_02000 [Terrabacteria group bacterium ANGP1]
MVDAWIAMVMGLLIFAGSLLSVEAGISVALIEIVLGVVAGNLLSVHTTPWIDYLAGFGSIVLTFLAGAEVDTGLTNLPIGKLIMASTFITNFGTAAALSIMFIRPTPWIFVFLLASAVIVLIVPYLSSKRRRQGKGGSDDPGKQARSGCPGCYRFLRMLRRTGSITTMCPVRERC